MLQRLRNMIRDMIFQVARRDIASFLQDHEEEILKIFREEIQRLDDQIPEEKFFIDIKMVPLGEMIIKAALKATNRFLTEKQVPQTGEESKLDSNNQ